MFEATNFNTREALENAIIEQHGKTTNPKEDTISGTLDELKKLNLSHGTSIWGVRAVATDYTEPVTTKRPNRGKIFDSKLNGKTTIKNAKRNKSRAA